MPAQLSAVEMAHAVSALPVPPTFPLLLTDHRPPCLHLQVVLAVGGRTLVYLELAGEGQIVEKGRLQLDSDIACLDITPVGE